MRRIPIEVSARHIHLSRPDIDALFDGGYQLTPARYISEPRQFAAVETVTLYTPKSSIENVRIVGPEREFTQIELARTDCFRLGIQNVPLRTSGELELDGTPGICVKSGAGEICVRQGVIVPWRHLHLNHTEALELNLEDGQLIKVRVGGERAVILENVYVRVQADFRLFLHLDTDEANAAGVVTGTEGELVR